MYVVISITVGKENDVRMTVDANGGGIAEIFKNGKWGTICDKAFNNKGWPLVYCRQMGFTKAKAKKASKIKGLPRSKLPVVLMAPTCRAKKTNTMADCKRAKVKCDHRHDVYIQCSGKIHNLFVFI